HDAVTMLGRPVDRVDAERLSAGIDEVVTRAGRDDDGVVGPDRRRLAVDVDLAGPPLDAEELIAVVMHFLADLLAGIERHQDELEVLAGVEHAAKVGVPLSQLLDVVGEALHGCPPGILDCRAGILPVCPHCAGGLPVFCPVPSLFGNSWLCGLRSDVQLETFVRGYESQALVESNRVGTRLVRGQLNQVTTLLPCVLDCPFEQFPTKSARSDRAVNTHALDEGAPTAAVRQVGDEGELEYADRPPILTCHNEFVVRICTDCIECRVVTLR